MGFQLASPPAHTVELELRERVTHTWYSAHSLMSGMDAQMVESESSGSGHLSCVHFEQPSM